MTILCIGSINIDHVYRMPALPKPGETVLSTGYSQGLGGKGANMAMAAARAGADVHFCGAVGSDVSWPKDSLAQDQIDVQAVALADVPTGHALIYVNEAAENMIAVHSGANHALTKTQIATALDRLRPGDWVLLQNETNLVPHAAEAARHRNLNVAYAAAPFDPMAAAAVLTHTTFLAVNAIEAEQLSNHLGRSLDTPSDIGCLVTRGADGASFLQNGEAHQAKAFPVQPIDTTGAGDTFLGVFLAGLDHAMPVDQALCRASAAAALQVTRPGAADAIPKAAEIDGFLADNPLD